MKLYDYFRSTASYRVRIALSIKNRPYESIPIHLVNNGGEQHHHSYQQVNPQALVPSLAVNDQIINQSLAIIEYLEETIPEPALLPPDPFNRAQVRSLALLVACDLHPLNNLRVINRLKDQFAAKEEEITHWYHHWLQLGLDAFEQKLRQMPRTQPVCFGDTVGLADLCLIPQVYNAHRFHFNMDNYPLINEINHYCLQQDHFKKAAPEAYP